MIFPEKIELEAYVNQDKMYFYMYFYLYFFYMYFYMYFFCIFFMNY
jgi:hypothetical protein